MSKVKTPIPVPAKEKLPHLMMYGTGGNKDYIVLARVGDVVLGLKPNAVIPGPEGTTYIGARIRSASAKGVFPEEGNVHSISNHNGDFAKPWPKILFEKEDEERASGQVCIYLDGDIKVNPDKVWEQTDGGQIGTRMAAYLKEVIGEEHLIISEEDIATHINSVFDPVFQHQKDKIAAHEKMKVAVKETKGQFGMQAELMKKIYGSTKEGQAKLEHHAAEDVDEEGGEADEEVPDFTDEAEEGQEDDNGPELPEHD